MNMLNKKTKCQARAFQRPRFKNYKEIYRTSGVEFGKIKEIYDEMYNPQKIIESDMKEKHEESFILGTESKFFPIFLKGF